MTSFRSIATICLLAGAAVAAPSTRAAVHSMPASEVKSFTLSSWGPLEKDTNGKAVFVDANLESADKIKAINSAGKRSVCYISAGTVENWRSDSSKFDDATAKKYKGFGGTETWLDITHWEDFKAPMSKRIHEAASKGCQFVELDNVDCDINGCVKGASASTLRSKQSEYINWLISTAHSSGMGVGLKNAQSHLPEFSSKIEFAINEECQKWGECGLYSGLVKANKAVFGVEYDNNGGKVCSEAKANHMITKYQNGGKWHNCF